MERDVVAPNKPSFFVLNRAGLLPHFFFPHQVEETVWYKLLYSFPPHLGGQMWPVANVVSCFGDTIIWISTSKIHESTDLLLRSMVNGNEPQTGDTIWINVHKWYIGSLASFIAMATCYQEWTYDMAVRPCAWHYIDLPSSPLSRAPISATSAHQWLCDPRCSWHAIPSKRVHTPSTQLGWEVCGDFTFAPCSCLLFNVSYPQDGSPH